MAMVAWFWLGVALAGEGDVSASLEVPHGSDEVIRTFSDLHTASSLWEGACGQEWVVGAPSQGEGARARVSYRLPFMKRRLTVQVDDVSDTRVVWDHLGRFGFYTYIEVEPSGMGSRVTMRAELEMPPWPVKGVYRNKVQPAWEACHEQVLRNLAATVPAPRASEPVAER